MKSLVTSFLLLLSTTLLCQTLQESFKDGVSNGKNLIGVNVGALVFNELDLRYARFFDVNRDYQWMLQIGAGIPIGDYQTPIYIYQPSIRYTGDNATLQSLSLENADAGVRLSAGLQTFRFLVVPQTSIGIGAGWIVQYRQLELFAPITQEKVSANNYSAGLGINVTAEPIERLLLIVSGGPAIERLSGSATSGFSGPDEFFYYLFGQVHIGFKF